jgi:hypothetical protein
MHTDRTRLNNHHSKSRAEHGTSESKVNVLYEDGKLLNLGEGTELVGFKVQDCKCSCHSRIVHKS